MEIITMDGLNEKKWFVYLGDHHEGPFSLQEIEGKMAMGQVTQQTFVWSEGMADWQPLPEIPDFSPLIRPPAIEASAPATASQGTAAESAGPPIVISAAQEIPISPTVLEPSAPRPSPAHLKTGRKRSPWTWALSAALVLGLFGVAYNQGVFDPLIQVPWIRSATGSLSRVLEPARIKLVEQVPALGALISPIPRLEGVSREDQADLKEAAVAPLDRTGPVAAMGVSTTDLGSAQVFISSNLPDGASFDVIVEGVPETLLNHLSFTGKGTATLRHKLAQSPAIRYPDGKALERGQYDIYVTESENQPENVRALLASAHMAANELPAGYPKGKRIVVKKTVFLGGPNDSVYLSRLKEYHDKVRARAESELTEIRQFVTTLETQYQATESSFKRLRRSKGVKAWADFDQKWSELTGQLEQTFQKWTPEALRDEYFYGTLFEQVRQAGKDLLQVHQLHQGYFANKVANSTSFEIQLGEANSQFQAALLLLKNKVEQASSMAPTANGMPRRDGL